MAFTSHIYCPDLSKINHSGYLVGWNLENFKCCIAFVIPLRDDIYSVENLKELLQQLSLSEELCEIAESCSRNHLPPTILGLWSPLLEDDYVPSPMFQEQPIWITLTMRNMRICLHSLYSVGCLYRTSSYFFQFDIPESDDMSYLSINSNVVSSPNSQMDRSDLEYTIRQINAANHFSRIINHALQKMDRQGHSKTAGRCNFISSSMALLKFLFYCILLCGSRMFIQISYFVVSIFSRTVSTFGLKIIYLHLFQQIRCTSVRDLAFTAAYQTERFTKIASLINNLALFSSSWSKPVPFRQKLGDEIISCLYFVWIGMFI